MLRLPNKEGSRGKHYGYQGHIRELAKIFPTSGHLEKNPYSLGLCCKDLPVKLASCVPADSLREWLKRILPKRLTFTQLERDNRPIPFKVGATPEELSPFVDGLARFLVAIRGGLSLGVPMLIMRLGENLTKSLITVSVAVVLFSGATSVVFRATNVETLAATATYAAVLVVFAGTSGG